MDTRRAIHDSPEPTVYSVAFNDACTRFICGLENGIRAFQAADCIRTLKEAPEHGHGIAVAALLDDRYLAIVGGGRHPNSSPNKLQFWDNVEAKKALELDLSEPVLGIRITSKLMAVILDDRTICFEYGTLRDSGLRTPTSVRGLYNTAQNPRALCCISGDLMILPGLTPGQVQLVSLAERGKRIIRAHTSALRQMDLSKNGEVIVTASEQGTLIRVFSATSLSQTHEFRRGVDKAEIYSLSLSPTNQFVASTSDKGTLHIFDIRPPVEQALRPHPSQRKRHSVTRMPSSAGVRPRSVDFDNYSLPSASSSPRTAAGAGFYGPPSDLAHTPPITAPSAFAALAKFPGMPRAFSDIRSMTSIPYHLGADPPNWQGQPAYTSTTLPSGQRTKVKNPNVALPGRSDGRPPKGVLAWDPDGGDRRLWVVGGGADARWEVFELAEIGDESGKLRVVKTGYRRYLTRQFAEES